VSGVSPVVDSLHAGTSTNLDQELLANIPSARLVVQHRGCSGRASGPENFGGAVS
jgi:hypothetical protein